MSQLEALDLTEILLLEAEAVLEMAIADDAHPEEVDRLTIELAIAQERHERFAAEAAY